MVQSVNSVLIDILLSPSHIQRERTKKKLKITITYESRHKKGKIVSKDQNKLKKLQASFAKIS